MKKITYLFTFTICLALAACLIDDPDISDEEGEVLVSAPDAGEANIITPGCDGPESDPHRVCEGDGGGGSGTGGGGGGTGGGGGSGGGSSGDPLPCFGADNNWCRTHQRCERRERCVPPGPDWVCYPINHDVGRYECDCFWYPV